MSLDFEALTDFTKQFDPWTVNDVGGGNTYGIQGVTFPGNYQPMAYICFNPSQTSPPLDNMAAHSGQKLGCSFSTTPPMNPNNKWLISPHMSLGVDPQIELWVKSYNNYFGDEKYRVAVSNTDNKPSSFVFLTAASEAAPTIWTRRTYNLSAYTDQDVYIGIQCVTDNGFIFMIDDISITSTVGISTPEPHQSLLVYPNPASDFVRVKIPVDFHRDITVFLIGLTGNVLKTWKPAVGQESLKLNVNDVPAGFYVLKVIANGLVSESKISVIH
jgi:hypothetical protein